MKTITTKQLTAGQRQQLWRGIKHKNPALADLLKNDTVLQALKQQFDAVPVFSLQEVTDYMTDTTSQEDIRTTKNR